MKPVSFEYARPVDVAGVLRLMGEGGNVKLLAGGQSLMPMLNMRLVQPDMVIDISGVAELCTVANHGEGLTLGACITHADIEDLRVPDVTRGALPHVARGIAYRAVRNRGTIGGSLTHADPSADWISLLAVLGASVTLRGPAGDRTIGVEDYMIGALEADLRDAEMLVSVTVPRSSPSARWGYYKMCRKTGEFAHAIGAFLIDPERDVCRAVLGATETRPIVLSDARALLGSGAAAGTPAAFDAAAAQDHAGKAGLTDPIARQTHVVALRRAIEQAHDA
jgi:carbon-monoxide dehydrogenase medium subunit